MRNLARQRPLSFSRPRWPLPSRPFLESPPPSSFPRGISAEPPQLRSPIDAAERFFYRKGFYTLRESQGVVRQRSFNWQSTAFVMRGLRVRLPPLALSLISVPAFLQLARCRTPLPAGWGESGHGARVGIRPERDCTFQQHLWTRRDSYGWRGRLPRIPTQLAVLRDSVAELEVSEDLPPATAVRLGCLLLPAWDAIELAVDTLRNADGGALALFYLGKAQFALGRLRGGDQQLQRGQGSRLQRRRHRRWRSPKRSDTWATAAGALATLDQLFGAVEQTAEYLYQRGATVAKLGGNPSEVVALVRRGPSKSDPRHRRCAVRIGLGERTVAATMSGRSNCTSGRRSTYPAHVGSLLNLGILYEDRQQFDAAQACYQRILDAYPDNERARLFRKDAVGVGRYVLRRRSSEAERAAAIRC